MFSHPLKNLRALGLQEHHIVADMGAGTGVYTLHAANLTPRGKVYAIDIERDFLTTIKNKAKDAAFDHVHIIWGDIEKRGSTKLGSGVIDVVIASNVLFQLEDKHTCIEEIKRILKPGGRVLFIDWAKTDAIPLRSKHLVPKDTAHDLFTQKGFALLSPVDVGAYQYGMIFIRN